MIKYTASKQLMHRLHRIRTGSLNYYTAEHRFFSELTCNYVELVAMSKHFNEQFSFFSPAPLQMVPIGGIMMPVWCFDAEEVK